MVKLMFADGFDHYATADIAKRYDELAVGDGLSGYTELTNEIAAEGRTGGCLKRVLAASQVTKHLLRGVGVSTQIHGRASYAWKCSALGNLPAAGGVNGMYVQFAVMQGGFVDLVFEVSTGGVAKWGWSSNSGGGWTWLGPSFSTGMASNAWHWIDHAWEISGSSGSIETRIDGVVRQTLTGVDTNFSGGNWTGIRLCMGAATGSTTFWLDDLIICSATTFTSGADQYLGQVGIKTLTVSGAGANADWTPSTGANYECVDDATPNGTDDVQSATAGDVDTYAFSDLSDTTQAVKAVQVTALATPVTYGAAAMKGVIRLSGTDYQSEDTLPATGSFAVFPFTRHPDTGEEMTATEVNGAEFGYERVEG